MQAQRIKFLKEELEKFPEDPFNYYALALEYMETSPEEAKNLFSDIIGKFPEYLPVYYQAANFYFEMDEPEKAEELFLAGIKLAESQRNEKTLRELKGSYSIFKSEMDDF